MSEVVHLRTAGVCSLLLDCTGPALPRVLHWGADLGDLPAAATTAIAAAASPDTIHTALDEPLVLSVLPEQSGGWLGTPGVTGHRNGRHFSPRFEVSTVEADAAAVVVEAHDAAAGLDLTYRIEMTGTGLLRHRASVVNRGDDNWTLDGVLLVLPVPAHATELLDFTGRHLRERSPQRSAFVHGTHLRENRRGRTGFDAATVLVAGEAGFGFGSGAAWGTHVAWSGNHRTLAERVPSGQSIVGGGELLLPGEVILAPGAGYETPWVYGAYGTGLDALAAMFHGYLRSRPQHPRSPRPVTLNTWEAVYFAHDLATLASLADVAASVGVERFVLDDGWFHGRRDDTSSLGDWYVDAAVWPDGLGPLVDHVRGLGMQFGLWFEPEMVSPNSDLARAHPDWILSVDGRMPPLKRSQQVLNLGHPDAFAFILERIDSILTEYDIGYIKWDHNRDLIEAGGAAGGAGVHEQTLATYRLLATLKERHPALEIESCSSGGARIDLGVLEHTDRVWTSDCIDALERQQIQRWTGQLLPPELLGAHVGSPVSHSTGRTHSLDFQAGTALFGHFGIEWDVSSASPEQLSRLAEWVRLYKRLRPLLHTGTVVRGDHPDPALWVHGVVAPDRGHAVYALTQVATSVHAPAGPVRLPGLDPDATYSVRPLPPADDPGRRNAGPSWWSTGVSLPGRVLGTMGLQAPTQSPEHLVLLEAHRT
ncbi:alpha-galactosidase [Virgisporangium aurantiacum]|uniref:alpha-galactosidase n=1 Tax=Virgisporangium aurantiacum TaxID=175570 RepID=A0A8J3Z104_9ACTN|nr:alpha-galactosidase [Virgisporangium aurantiacum]GIJ53256.1 alpha-galactosidase [Virgisporangium aurantiacum]